MSSKILGVIGGSGLYQMEGLENIEEVEVATPFGEPSDKFITGTVGGVKMVFLPRHGRGHRVTPTEINYRANLWGMRSLGVRHLVSVSAVGSMKEEIVPGHMIFVKQFIDFTKGIRPASFFGDGIVSHVSMADPICKSLSDKVCERAKALDIPSHDDGTYICIEGPQFSTRGESLFYRSMGVSVIGMTNIPEYKLAREAGICYATVALATDFDCWHPGHDDVTLETVIHHLNQNATNAQKVLKELASSFDFPACSCHSAVKNSIVTDPKLWPSATHEKVKLLLED